VHSLPERAGEQGLDSFPLTTYQAGQRRPPCCAGGSGSNGGSHGRCGHRRVVFPPPPPAGPVIPSARLVYVVLLPGSCLLRALTFFVHGSMLAVRAAMQTPAAFCLFLDDHAFAVYMSGIVV